MIRKASYLIFDYLQPWTTVAKEIEEISAVTILGYASVLDLSFFAKF
jgi:hypothetical protein